MTAPATTPFDLHDWLADRRREIDALLDQRLPLPQPPDADPGRLIESMRYSLLAPGKRLRPALGLAAVQAVGTPIDEPMRIATVTIELVHCYSLVHDDLPAMDNDDVRRGRPTNHKVFGDATAILAGDALLTLAFDWLAQAGQMAGTATAGRYLEAAGVLARAAGAAGMVRGQARDLGEPAPTTLAGMETLHLEKTGALFQAAVEVGAVVAGATAVQRSALNRFGRAYGVAFQHADDIADQEHRHLAEQARQRLHALTDEALQALASGGFGAGAAPLVALAKALAASIDDTMKRIP